MEIIQRELRLLKVYSALLTLVCIALFAWVFKIQNSRGFEEINVERINVVEKDGKLRMVISNKERQHPGTMDGVTFVERKGMRPPGLMFFSEKGDELGGLVFDGNAADGQGGSLTFDKFRGDQTIQFIHDEKSDGSYFAGLKLNDQNMPLTDLLARQNEILQLPSKEEQDAAWKDLRGKGLLMTERVRIGKDHDRSSILHLKDAKGKVRIELKVSSAGDSKINFLDELGRVIFSLPPTSNH